MDVTFFQTFFSSLLYFSRINNSNNSKFNLSSVIPPSNNNSLLAIWTLINSLLHSLIQWWWVALILSIWTWCSHTAHLWVTNICRLVWTLTQWDKVDILTSTKVAGLEVVTTNHTRTSIIKSTIRSIKHRYVDILKHTDPAL